MLIKSVLHGFFIVTHCELNLYLVTDDGIDFSLTVN